MEVAHTAASIVPRSRHKNSCDCHGIRWSVGPSRSRCRNPEEAIRYCHGSRTNHRHEERRKPPDFHLCQSASTVFRLTQMQQDLRRSAWSAESRGHRHCEKPTLPYSAAPVGGQRRHHFAGLLSSNHWATLGNLQLVKPGQLTVCPWCPRCNR